MEIIGGRNCYIYECGSADTLLIQPVDDHDIAVLDSEVEYIRKLAEGRGFTLAAFKVNDWNTDLSPWEAAPVFGNEPFGSGAEETLGYITESLLPELLKRCSEAGSEDTGTSLSSADDREGCRVLIGGYSLAGFFSLWAAYQTDIFDGVAAASPSVWFPGWIEYAEGNCIKAPYAYLSLGDKEERTRNPVMRTVGDNIRRQLELLEADRGCLECTLEMNQGNHFKEPDLRTAKAFAWLLSRGIN